MTEQQIDAIKSAEAPAQEPHGDTAPEPKSGSGKPAEPHADPVADDAADTLAASLVEAEERGYRRGREEALAELVTNQGMWQPLGSPDSPAGRMTRAADGFLSGLRPGVWER